MTKFTATFQNGYTATKNSSKDFEFAVGAFDGNGKLVKVAFAADLMKAYTQRDRFVKKFGGYADARVVRTVRN